MKYKCLKSCFIANRLFKIGEEYDFDFETARIVYNLKADKFFEKFGAEKEVKTETKEKTTTVKKAAKVSE